MTAKAEATYFMSGSAPRRRRQRRKKTSRISPTALILAAALLLTAAVGCWKGLELMLGGIQRTIARHSLETTEPVASFAETAPPQSIPADGEPPVLAGIRDFVVYQYETPDYLGQVTLSDNQDPNPSVSVDSSGVQLDQPGVYQAVYTASDLAGNTSQASCQVTVLQRGEGFVNMADILLAADAKLAQITDLNASAEKQVYDIYVWARMNLHYGDGFEHGDWRQAAYTMLTEGTGDCFGYFAVTKLLFEQLGIPNIDVQKAKKSGESDHFWSLVSVDGGETWYHFDATPRYGSGDDFCLVTDAFLDAYSEAHGGTHNRDKSLYPETP